ncbi:hypothetical protein F5Y11DRAFT_316039 [Daldinia sp. FL1419]|nr:hypothetical protein F5Y11DRAFT_316039 [Daldinia sp. FL1419]
MVLCAELVGLPFVLMADMEAAIARLVYQVKQFNTMWRWHEHYALFAFLCACIPTKAHSIRRCIAYSLMSSPVESF